MLIIFWRWEWESQQASGFSRAASPISFDSLNTEGRDDIGDHAPVSWVEAAAGAIRIS
jgi:hypothetical protein